MTAASYLALLVSIILVTVANSHGNSGNNNNNNNNNAVWKNWPGFTKTKWNNLSWYLKKLPQKQFFGMKFILNVTGEVCTPQWTHPKPGCWGHGWPWPWPGHGGGGKTTTSRVTTRATTKGPNPTTTKGQATTTKDHATTTKGQATTTKGQATTTKGQATTTKGQATTTTTKAASTTTTTKPTSTSTTTRPTSTSTIQVTSTKVVTTNPPTTPVPTTPGGPGSTTTCPYDIDSLDELWCRDIIYSTRGTGPLKDCAKYYSNETMVAFYNECVNFNCRYQRAYICYSVWTFVQNCSAYLQEDETTWGWRYDNNCDQNSTPFPVITFTEPPSTAATVAVGKRSVDEVEESSDDEESDVNALHEGTDETAFGIKNNWCVPRIYSWWWRNHGGSLPGHSSEDHDDSNNGWSSEEDDDNNDNSHGNGNGGGKDDSSNDDSGDKSHNGGGGKGHGNGGGGKGNGNGNGNGGGKGHGGKDNDNGGKGNGKKNANGKHKSQVKAKDKDKTGSKDGKTTHGKNTDKNHKKD